MKALILMCLLCSASGSTKEVLGIVGTKNATDGITSNQEMPNRCEAVTNLVLRNLEADAEPDVSWLKITLHSPGDNHTEHSTSYNLTEAAREIPLSAHFNPDKKLVVFIHGLASHSHSVSSELVKNAFFKQGNISVLDLDARWLTWWQFLRSSAYVRYVGEKLGEVLAALKNSGVKPSSIHIIGHGLGAHMVGFAGKTFIKLTSEKVGRISALDPAGPCFNNLDPELRLKADDAEYVDVIHTDADGFGLLEAIGHTDYYPNGGRQQPNCMLSMCSHNRAWEYFAESLEKPFAFPAVRCRDWQDFKGANDCIEINYMGYSSSPGMPGQTLQSRGSFFLQTRGESPFSLAEKGQRYKIQKDSPDN